MDRDAARRVADARARARRGRSCASRSRRRGPGLVAGLALAWGRALGEFGATLMFAGSFRGITQTVPLAIYERFSTDFTGALALSAVLVAVSAALLLAVKLAGRLGVARRCCALRPPRGSGRSTSTSRSRSAPGAASRSPGRPARARRRCCASPPGCVRPERGRCRCGDEVWLDTRAGSTWRPSGGASATSSRSTRCSRTAGVAERRLRAARRWRGRERRGARARAARAVRDRATLADARPRDAVGRRAPAGRGGARAGARAGARCCSTSRCRRSTRARARRRAASSAPCSRDAGVPALLVTHDFTEAAVLGDARRRDRRRPRRAGGDGGRAGGLAGVGVRGRLHGRGRPHRGRAPGRRRADVRRRSTAAGVVVSTEPGDGPVAVSVYPWEIALEPAGTSGTARPRTTWRSRCVSVTAVGNRVRVGLAAPQPLVGRGQRRVGA